MRLIFAFLLLLCATSHNAAQTLNLPTGDPALPAPGYIDFCRRVPEECVARGTSARIVLTEQVWDELTAVNVRANLLIVQETDEELYHRDEYWAIPSTSGDCEDIAILKRKWLENRGWPTSALLLATAWDENDEGHAVLIVHMEGGDLVLDNKVASVYRWFEYNYRFIKLQSPEDPNQWVFASDTHPRTLAHTASAP